AAEDIEDRGLRAWVLSREALSPFYQGNLLVAGELAEGAETLARGTESSAAASAPLTLARVRAKLGDATGARNAIDRARTALDRLPPETRTDLLYGYTERQLECYSAEVWTYTKDLALAEQAHAHAATLYASTTAYLDPALMDFNKALRLIAGGDAIAAAEHAATVITSLAPEQPTEIIDVRARAVLRALPSSAQRSPAVETYRDVLAFGAVSPAP